MREQLGDMSVREKNLWFDLLVNIVVAVYYYPRMFALIWSSEQALAGAAMTGLIINTVILAIVISVVLQVFLHTKGKPEPRDERDYRIDARSSIWFGRLLVSGVVLVMAQIVIAEFNPFVRDFSVALTPLLIAHLLLIVIMLASTASSVIKLWLYRVGV